MYINIISNKRGASLKVQDTNIITVIEELKNYISFDKWNYSTESEYQLKPNIYEFIKFLVVLGDVEQVNKLANNEISEEDICCDITGMFDILRYNRKYLNKYIKEKDITYQEANQLISYIGEAIELAQPLVINYKITEAVLDSNRNLIRAKLVEIANNFSVGYLSPDNVLKSCRDSVVEALNKLESVIRITGYNENENIYLVANLKSKLAGMNLKW